jgi:hypothetical protein
MRSIVLWLLGWLEKSLDPDLQARLKVLNANIAEAEAKEKEAALIQQRSDAAYSAAIEYRRGITDKITANQAQLDADQQTLNDIEAQRKKIADELQKAKDAIAAQSDHDAVRGNV